MMSFRFTEKFLCFWIRVEIKDRVSGNTFKYVFGQTSIRASVLHPAIDNCTTLVFETKQV